MLLTANAQIDAYRIGVCGGTNSFVSQGSSIVRQASGNSVVAHHCSRASPTRSVKCRQCHKLARGKEVDKFVITVVAVAEVARVL